MLNQAKAQLCDQFKALANDILEEKSKPLAEQVKQLMSLNKQISQDVHNLTSALKGKWSRR